MDNPIRRLAIIDESRGKRIKETFGRIGNQEEIAALVNICWARMGDAVTFHAVYIVSGESMPMALLIWMNELEKVKL
jgi:hypothetical protein